MFVHEHGDKLMSSDSAYCKVLIDFPQLTLMVRMFLLMASFTVVPDELSDFQSRLLPF